MTLAGPAARWRDALGQGRFLIQRSAETGAFHFPPRVARAGHDDLAFVSAAGGGTVYAVTLIRPKPPTEPYNVVIVELDEGPRLMSRVVDRAPDQVAIGLRVRAFVGQEDGEPILLFRPESDH